MSVQHDSAPAQAFAHMMFPYAGAQAYLAGTLAYIEQARAVGAMIVVATHEQRRTLLTEHLEDAKNVMFVDTAALGRNPGRLIPAWREWIGQAAADRGVHGVSEPAWPSPGSAHDGEARYREWLLNLAFAQAPPWTLLCPVDTTGRADTQIKALARCHPLVWNGTSHQASTDYLADAYDMEQLPEPPAQHQTLEYRIETLGPLREHVATWARGHGLATRRVRELTLAASELASNSIRHGGGHGTLRTWIQDDALVCEFHDAGVITDPLAGQLSPSPTQLGGRGLWFVNQFCDLMQIRSAPGHGTRIRIWIDLPAHTSAPAASSPA